MAGFLATLKRDIVESRFHPSNPDAKFIRGWLGNRSTAGVDVTEDTSMKVTAVYNAVRLLSETHSTVPLNTLRHTGPATTEKAKDYYLWELLHHQANSEQTSTEWRAMMMGHLAMRGNAYSFIERSDLGRITQLVPFHPDRVRPRRISGRVVYDFTFPNGRTEKLPKESVFHVRTLQTHGLRGIGPLDVGLEALGHAIAVQEFSNRFFSNGSTLGGIFTHPGTLRTEQRDSIRKSLEDVHRGVTQAHRFAVLEAGLEWQQLGINPQQAQLLASRNFAIADVARLFNVPLHLLKELSRSTNNNIEQQSLEWVIYTMRPWFVLWEQAMRRDLLTTQERQLYSFKFNVDGLLRGDLKTRYEVYRVARQWGLKTPDEIRELEDENPLAAGQGGDQVWIPKNMDPASRVFDENGDPLPLPESGGAGGGPGVRSAPELRADVGQSRLRHRGIHHGMFADAAGRLVRREVLALRAIVDKTLGGRDAGSFEEAVENYYKDFGPTASEIMGASVQTYAQSALSLVADEVGEALDFDSQFDD